MKFTYKAILLLLLLCLSHVVDANEKIKRSSHSKKRLTHKKSHSKAASHSGRTTGVLQDIKDKIVEFVKDPWNILFFILGATSAWIPAAETFYRFIRENPITKLNDLFESCKGTWETLFHKSKAQPTPAPTFTMSSKWDTLKTSERKIECENMQKNIQSLPLCEGYNW